MMKFKIIEEDKRLNKIYEQDENIDNKKESEQKPEEKGSVLGRKFRKIAKAFGVKGLEFFDQIADIWNNVILNWKANPQKTKEYMKQQGYDDKQIEDFTGYIEKLYKNQLTDPKEQSELLKFLRKDPNYKPQNLQDEMKTLQDEINKEEKKETEPEKNQTLYSKDKQNEDDLELDKGESVKPKKEFKKWKYRDTDYKSNRK